MAHEIDMTTGRAAVFVTGTPAWHGLGTVVREAQTSNEAIKLAGLDWTVEKWPVAAVNPLDGVAHVVPDKVANVRTDTKATLGIVSSGYQPLQNREAFDLMDALVHEKLAMYETAGSLKGGQRVWILARLPQEIRVTGDDVIHPYALLANGHDGKSALRILATSTRVVCQNTLNLAIRNASSSEGLCVYHFENFQQRLKEAREKLNIIQERFTLFGEQVKTLLGKQLASQELTEYFESLLPDQSDANQKKIFDTWMMNFEDATNTMPGVQGSLWAALNSVTHWTNHQRTSRGANSVARQDSKLESLWFGSSNTINQAAFNKALELVGVNYDMSA